MKKLILMTEVMDRLGLRLLGIRDLLNSGALTPIDVVPSGIGIRVARFDADEVESIKERLVGERIDEFKERLKELRKAADQPQLFTLPAR